MRADRLISLLLLLQRHPRVTVAAAAEELEVSTRTARRDFEALAMAGVPVYSQPGRGGGWSLIGGATTDLSGLNRSEARALFLAAGAARDAHTVDALRKLGRALPEPFRQGAEAMASRSMIDDAKWGRVSAAVERPTAFPIVADAVSDGLRIEFRYRGRAEAQGRPTDESSRRQADPLGLVQKTGTWYLVANTHAGRRTFRVDRMSDVTATGHVVEPPDGFDLATAWAETNESFIGAIGSVSASGTLDDHGVERSMRFAFGARLTIEDHRFTVTSWSLESLVRELAPFATALSIATPSEVRVGLARLGAALVERHGSASTDGREDAGP